jgi:plastocyanin
VLRKLAHLALLSPLFLSPLAPAAPPQATAPVPDLVVIEIRNDGLHPQDALVKLGGTVRWVNRDAVTHTIRLVSTTPGRPDSDTSPIPPGGSVEVGLRKSFPYFVEENPSWKGTVTGLAVLAAARPHVRP